MMQDHILYDNESISSTSGNEDDDVALLSDASADYDDDERSRGSNSSSSIMCDNENISSRSRFEDDNDSLLSAGGSVDDYDDDERSRHVYEALGGRGGSSSSSSSGGIESSCHSDDSDLSSQGGNSSVDSDNESPSYEDDDDVNDESVDDEVNTTSQANEKNVKEYWTWRGLARQEEEESATRAGTWRLARLIMQSAAASANGDCTKKITRQVRALVQDYVVSLWNCDSNYLSPLHFAVEVGAPLDVIKILGNGNPFHIVYGYRTSSYRERVISFKRSAIHIATHDASVRHYLIERGVQYLLEDPTRYNFLQRIREFFRGHRRHADVVGCLLDKYPIFSKCRADFSGQDAFELPLHYAIRARTPIDVLERLISSYPEALMEEQTCGKIALHLACHCCVSSYQPLFEEEIRLFANLASVRVRDEFACLPLHIICGKENQRPLNSKAIRLLVDLYPESVQKRSSKGDVPLFLVCENATKADLDIIQYMIEKCPQSLDAQNAFGETPLRAACRSYRSSGSEDSFTVVQLLAGVYPESVCKSLPPPISWHRSQVHYECAQGQWKDNTSLRLIKCLVETVPQSVRQLDCFERSPLHNLCRHADDEHLQTVQFLADKFPESLGAKDYKGNTPLHSLIKSSKANEKVIRFLVDRCPEVLEPVDDGTETPLHALCTQHTISASRLCNRFRILSISARAVMAKNKQGQTAFHLLCKVGAPSCLLHVLDAVCPDLANKRDADGRTPLHLAVEALIASEASRFDEDDYSYDSDSDHSFYYLSSQSRWTRRYEGRALRGRHGETMSYLLKTFAAGINVMDNDGVSPLMVACERDASVDFIYQLVSVDPVANLGLERL